MDRTPRYSEHCAADLEQSSIYLFRAGKDVPERTRSSVHLFKVRYCSYQYALHRLIDDWLHGTVGIGPPTQAWDIDAVRKVNELNKPPSDGGDDVMEDEVRTVYDDLIAIKVLGHLRKVASHRFWIRGSFQFCKLIGVKFSDRLDNLVWRHDLSKYSHKEVLGYAIMFGDGSVDFRQLQTEDEKFEWDNTLYNHYGHNPHHPEYFYPLQEDGRRVRDKSMMELDPVSGQDYLDESIVDMLGSRGERYLAEDPEFSVSKWFDIPDRFMGRYAEADKSYVIQKLAEWLDLAGHFMQDKDNAKKVQGLFDTRPVVFK